MRTSEWLEQKFEIMLANNFADMDIKNPIFIKFGRKSKRRLGSIALREVRGEQDKMSIIVLNGYFRSEEIPEEVILITIAHELVHYLHGFNSYHEQAHDFPHKGSIVNKELRRRGFSEQLQFQHQWLRVNWKNIIAHNY